MRILVLLAGLLLVGLCVPMRSAEITEGPLAPVKKGKDGKLEPQNVPGTFHPFNVTVREKTPEEQEEADKEAMEKGEGKDKEKFAEERYTSKDKFHCLVTEYDLDPVVMLFARGLNDSEGFKELLTKLDAACTKYRLRRLRAFVVFRVDGATDVTKDDEKRKELAADARKIADDLKLKNVVLTLDTDADLEKYKLGKSALTAVLYRALRIRSSHTFNSDELDKKDAPAIDALMKDVEKHLVVK
jgi:hypothetical protein